MRKSGRQSPVCCQATNDPVNTGYRAYLAPAISRRGEEGFSSCSACPCHRAVATTPPKWVSRVNQVSAAHAAFAFRLQARPSEYTLEATSAFTSRYGPMTRNLPKGDLVDRLQKIGFPPPCYPSYGAPDSCPGGICLPLNRPALAGHTTRRADCRHRALQWNHAARTRVPGHGERMGLASCGTQLAPVRRTGRCVVRPVYALATATARVVPFACACDDVRHSASLLPFAIAST